MSNYIKFQYDNMQHAINLDLVNRISYNEGYLYIEFNRGVKVFDGKGDTEKIEQLKAAYAEILRKI